MKYVQQKQELANQEQAARAQSAHGRSQIYAKWASVHAGFSGELTVTHQRFAQDRAQADTNLTSARKRTDVLVWQRELAEREVVAYKNVSYLRYLISMLRP
jgi:hypothetical protein